MIAGFALVLWVGVRLALNGLGSWPGAVVGGLLSCALVTWQIVRRRRREAAAIGTESDAVPTLERRLMKQDLPDDPAEREAMGRLVTRRLAKVRRGRLWALPMMAVFCLVPPVVLFAQGSRASGTVYGIFGVVFFGWLVWMNRRMTSRLTWMDRRIGDAGRQSPAGRTGLSAS